MKSATAATKELVGVYQVGSRHMVGDGLPVRNMIPGTGVDEQLSPFLLLDYMGPADFPPTDRQLGVGEHPHRGFETVTIMYQGRLTHRDSSRNPVLAAVSENAVVGFAALNPWSPKCGYARAAEISVYVRDEVFGEDKARVH